LKQATIYHNTYYLKYVSTDAGGQSRGHTYHKSKRVDARAQVRSVEVVEIKILGESGPL